MDRVDIYHTDTDQDASDPDVADEIRSTSPRLRLERGKLEISGKGETKTLRKIMDHARKPLEEIEP